MNRWRNAEGARTLRWKRENEAPRLKNVIPALRALRFEIEETRNGGTVGSARSVRHIVVDTAAALFEFPCGDSKCQDGGHDITQQVLHELRSSHEQFEGEDVCRGAVAGRDCGRLLRFKAHAQLG
jgi:hypothetical protein